MSTDLDTRLRSLSELSPPSHGPLGASELHQRATKRQQRAVALRAVPAAVVVIALLAGAFALAGRSSSTDVVVGPPDGEALNTLSERDTQVVGFLQAAAELRHQLDREMVLSAAYASTAGTVAGPELQTQRTATDAALATYSDRKPAVGGEPGLDEAIKQADNRLERLDTNRRSVDTLQSDALGQIDPYAKTSAALQGIALGYLQEVDDPDVFRGVLTASNLGNYARMKAGVAATLTIPVEIGYYAGILPKGMNPTVDRGECGDDPSGAGNACPVYVDAIAQNIDSDQLEYSFVTFATGEQKQLYRAADAGSDFDQMLADIFDNGVGKNDLTGTVPGSVAVDPAAWRAAALQRIDRLAAVEQEMYARVLTGGSSRPVDPGGSGSSPGTPPPSVVLSPPPSEGSVSTTVGTAPESTTSVGPATGTTVEERSGGRSTTERVTETPPPPTSAP